MLVLRRCPDSLLGRPGKEEISGASSEIKQ